MTQHLPTLTLDRAILRAQMLGDIRWFFGQRGVLEITTPILSNYGNTEVFIDSVTVNKSQGKIGYLHTSPEFAMKRVLADYRTPIFQICQVFRANEQGSRHNSEFTMLEWYRPDFDLDALASELMELLAVALGKSLPFKRYRYSQAFMDVLGLHPFASSLTAIKMSAKKHGVFVELGDDRQGYLDVLFGHVIEPTLGFDLPTLITDYPPATAALAKIDHDEDGFAVAKRFELYIDGLEIANAYDELADGQVLLARFRDDNAKRHKLGLPIMPIDMALIQACDELPACSGIALGIDRLFMVREKLTHIDEALTFNSQNA